MATLKLHHEGWLALPTGLRQKLGLKSGDRLEAELVRGTIVLRRAKRPTAPRGLPDEPEAEPERAAAPMAGKAEPMPAAAPAKAPPAARRAARKPAQATLPAALKSRGRRKAKEPAEGSAGRS